MSEDDLEGAKALDDALARDLRAAGIHDLRELRAVGAAEAWERLLRRDLRDTLGDRLRLEAAVRGRFVASLDPEIRERCAEHVRRRLAPEPVRGGGAPRRYSLARSSQAPDPDAAADRRRVWIALAAFAVPVVAFVVAKALV